MHAVTNGLADCVGVAPGGIFRGWFWNSATDTSKRCLMHGVRKVILANDFIDTAAISRKFNCPLQLGERIAQHQVLPPPDPHSPTDEL